MTHELAYMCTWDRHSNLNLHQPYTSAFGNIKNDFMIGENDILLRPVGKCGSAFYPPSVIQVPGGGAECDLDDFRLISGRTALSNRA